MEKFAKKGMAALVGLALVSAAGSALALETRFAVQDSSGNDKMVVTDEGKIGIGLGTLLPTAPVMVRGASYPTTQVISHAYTVGATSKDVAGGFIAKRNNDSTINGGLPVAGDRVGYMLFGSVGTDGLDKNAAGFGAYAESTWTNTNFPAYFAIETAASSQRAEKMRVTGAGNVGIGTTAPTQKLEVNGGIRLNPTAVGTTPAPVKPTCSAAAQGVIFFTKGATATTADLLEVCSKDGAGNYAWRSLIAP